MSGPNRSPPVPKEKQSSFCSSIPQFEFSCSKMNATVRRLFPWQRSGQWDERGSVPGREACVFDSIQVLLTTLLPEVPTLGLSSQNRNCWTFHSSHPYERSAIQNKVFHPANRLPGDPLSMKHKGTVCQAGLLFLVLLRQAHTRVPHSRARRLPIGVWQSSAWSKSILNLNNATAPGNAVFRSDSRE